MIIILDDNNKETLIKLISLCLSNNLLSNMFSKNEIKYMEFLRNNMEESNER